MDNKQLLRFIGGGYWQISKEMRKAFGVMESLWITHLLEWQQHLITEGKIKEDGYFFLSQENISRETGISADTQTTYCKKFIERGIILKKENIGLPARNYYYVDAIKMIETIHEINLKQSNNNPPPSPESRVLVPHADGVLVPHADMVLVPHADGVHNNHKNNNPVVNNDSSYEESGSSTPKSTSVVKKQKTSRQNAEDIFDYWNNYSDILPKHLKTRGGVESKLHHNAIEIIERELNKGLFSKNRITMAIDYYADMLSNPDDYVVKSKFPSHRVDICSFFKFDREYIKSLPSWDIAKYIDSWFAECIQGQKYLLKKYGAKEKAIEDKYPEVTEKFKKLWSEKMQVDPNYKNGGGIRDENSFRKASVILMEFIDKWKEHIDGKLPMHEDGWYGDIRRPETLAYDFINAIDFNIEGQADIKVTPGWLCTKTMETRLVDYFRDQGILADGIEN